ncbi:pre-piRNA 3'-exonuclease trimmer [Lingula anatina]|uniref:Pre-piRNA 3'-exonuclease trimmer n=1 Tax=Lingula anatina TaxID=7574 RepID=A0A1S3H980_LINAN|nr:pre-piRNA 3'-exonuclease trimmer [Lingula anatina]|eukprot:XP_013382568.1 pre-piRNA 3'-exonuclease trimmer [Lingula anatina]
MCDVLRSNFEDEFPRIEEAINRAKFIAIDSEFTGLRINNKVRPSLFDDGAQRYGQLKSGVSQFQICQFGVSAFVKEENENKYTAYTFNFHIFPSSFGPIDPRFMCQVSSLEFLCTFNFDFNKFIYEGVPFLNRMQEQQLRSILRNQSLFDGQERDVDEDALQKACSEVAEWVVEAKDGDTKLINRPKRVADFILHEELLQRFDNIWPERQAQLNPVILVTKVPVGQRKKLEDMNENSQEYQEERMVNLLKGFSRVIDLISNSKKPLIGHNMLLDLMLIHDKFYLPLPDDYLTFKKNIHQLFPCIIDTKHFSSEIRKSVEDSGLLKSTSLGTLYEEMDSDLGKGIVLCQPAIHHAPGYRKYVDGTAYHEAGFDSFAAGYVFLRMCHMHSLYGLSSMQAAPLEFSHYMTKTKPFHNNINMIRAAIDHICLDGADPPSRRPQWLHVQSRTYKLKTVKLARLFSSHGSVDIKMLGERKALVAVANYRVAKDILKSFHNHEQIKVAKYNIWRHSPVVRGVMWTGLALSGGICLWALFSSQKKD